MIKRLLSLLTVLVTVWLTGCASTAPMALQEGEKITPQSKPIYLMTVAIRNDYKDSYQPAIASVQVEKNGENSFIVLDERAEYAPVSAGKKGKGYLLRLQLDEGRYVLRGMHSRVFSVLAPGSYFTPLHSTMDVKAPGVYYLGHVRATVRERKGDEFKAGPSVPLIDQAVAGASGGTWDVEIVDRFDMDEKFFRTRFPALTGVTIQKAILPPFNRPVAQKWWEDN